MGGKSLGSVIVIFMFILQSWAASVHAPADGPAEVLDASNDTGEVIPAPSVLNAPGFHEGTVFSEATLAAGGHHTCAILDNGSVSCWGDDEDGQLGNGLDSEPKFVPDSVLFGINASTDLIATSISAGFSHTCVLASSSYGNGVSCWGSTAQQQASQSWWSSGNLEEPSGAMTPSGSFNSFPVALDSGADHTCAVMNDGNVSCWGANNRGQVGSSPSQLPSTGPQYSTFVDMSTFGPVKALGLGGDHSCAIVVNGSVACWGNNSVGQLLGRGYTNAYDDTPWYVQPFGQNRKAVAIDAGETQHALCLMTVPFRVGVQAVMVNLETTPRRTETPRKMLLPSLEITTPSVSLLAQATPAFCSPTKTCHVGATTSSVNLETPPPTIRPPPCSFNP